MKTKSISPKIKNLFSLTEKKRYCLAVYSFVTMLLFVNCGLIKITSKKDDSDLIKFLIGARTTTLGSTNAANNSSKAVVTTVAGMAGSSGTNDATGSSARFNRPNGIAIDSSGNLYIADQYNNSIRKITSGGVVTTLAGSTSGSSGNLNGVGTAARFDYPIGVAVDSSGNVFVSEQFNNCIRKITSAGIVTTLAGSTSGISGNIDGTGSAARFYSPQGITIDPSGNLYLTDYFNHNIRKVTNTGVVTTFAGSTNGFSGSNDATGTSARFNRPIGITIDSSGNLIVVESINNTIRKITPSGDVTTFLSLSSNSAVFDTAGNLYLASTFNHIKKISPTGVETIIAGSESGNSGVTDGIGTSARFDGILGIIIDSSGSLYVTDNFNHTIRKILP